MFHTHTHTHWWHCSVVCSVYIFHFLFYLQQVQARQEYAWAQACVCDCSHHESLFWFQKNTDCVNFWLGSRSLYQSSFTLQKKNAQSTTLLLFGKALFYTSGISASRRQFQRGTASTFQNVKTGQLIKLCTQETLLHILCISICACEWKAPLWVVFATNSIFDYQYNQNGEKRKSRDEARTTSKLKRNWPSLSNQRGTNRNPNKTEHLRQRNTNELFSQKVF